MDESDGKYKRIEAPFSSGSLISRATITEVSENVVSTQPYSSLISRATVTETPVQREITEQFAGLLSTAKVTDLSNSEEKSTRNASSTSDNAGFGGFSFPVAAEIASSVETLAPKERKKVALKPQFSQMAWLNLKMQRDLRFESSLTLEEVAKHSTEKDCWMILRGKVYNISSYLDYHPGGKKILLKAGGTDGTELFDKYHRWVNIDFLMSKCLVGALSA
eukprot:CAMPEP_0196599420 /NCGR_PEP_ID=MMETSP1081-20130531/94849_1 /TAXON_ID=36882 /ORGANISM="Pyramimonas amylifera, Strain CCMP720" /LENGTH=219 /DNA_ID=CAMNT_0041925191 /DNA_START=97 /DNA_END=756 /DNA_ORIENTATION=-